MFLLTSDDEQSHIRKVKIAKNNVLFMFTFCDKIYINIRNRNRKSNVEVLSFSYL